ncbi:MAG: hypothetical protein EKK51_10345 [Mycolicibacterium sp.]|nr:MAG: hypothetical protein EKK51_10345 [Mycolicibacterium sp.]
MGKLLLLVYGERPQCLMCGPPQRGCSERNTKRRCGYSAATTTTATTRNAAQIYCAALGEQELAGG